MSLMFSGIGVSRGIAIGEAYLLRRNQIDVSERSLAKKAVPAEVRRLKRALKNARDQLLTARDHIPKDAPTDVSAFIETHILMLDDDVLSTRPVEIIRTEHINAEAALQKQREELARVFGSMEDSYLATRIDDVNHVIDTVLRALDPVLAAGNSSTKASGKPASKTTPKTATKAATKAALKAVTKASTKDSDMSAEKGDVPSIASGTAATGTASGEATGSSTKLGNEQWKGRIIVADDLTPADTIAMKHHGVAGFVTETGGQLSHSAILARSLGIPAIVGVASARRYLRSGEILTLDGSSGLVLAEPTEEILEQFRKQRKALRKQQRELGALIDTESVTRDGVAVILSANIEIDDDIKALRRVNAAGVGLYRTEFLYMNRDDVPDEQEHFRVYTKVIRALKGELLTIRTADLGADKGHAASGDTGSDMGTSSGVAHNPAMGLRGIRLCLTDTSLFVPQLRAILRASARGPVRILLPMLTNMAEVRQSLALIEQVKKSLQEEGIEFDEKIPIGAMIEVPAAAVVADRFASELDFLSIGTNDLIQYSLAIDRVDNQVNYLYDPLHPAVLTLIRQVIDAGRAASIPVSLCGEMAGDPRYVRLLLGLGLTEFSMPPNQLLEVKRALIESRRSTLKKQAIALLEAETPDEQQALLERINGPTRAAS